jgi:hypothetical protein
VPLVNLCRSCWGKEIATWGRTGSETYATIPGKTIGSGSYFNNQHQDYYEGGEPDIDKIVSTGVHEMSHYWSRGPGHNGLVGRNYMGYEWDERVTDYLARKTYFEMGSRLIYRSGWGALSEFITRGVNRRHWPYERPVIELFPPPFNRAFAPEALQEIQQELAKRFVTWYFNGGGREMENFFNFQYVWPTDAHRTSTLGEFFFFNISDTTLRAEENEFLVP